MKLQIINYYIDQVKEGNNDAFRFLLNQYSPLVKKIAKQKHLRYPDFYTSEDEIIAMACKGLWQSIKTYDKDSNKAFTYYVIKAINKIINKDLYNNMAYKKHFEQPADTDTPAQFLKKTIILEHVEDIHIEGPAEKLLKKEEYAELKRAVSQLPPFHQKVLRLHYRLGLSVNAIARYHGHSKAYTSRLLSEARSMLKTKLRCKT